MSDKPGHESKQRHRSASRASRLRQEHVPEPFQPPSRDPVVVTAADDAYALPLAVMGRSLIDNLEPGTRLRLYVLDAGIRCENKRKVIDSWDLDTVDLEWIRPQTSRLKGLLIFPRFGAATYYRLLIPSILPISARRAIYLDADTLILEDVRKLWETDLRGLPLGAVRDPFYPTMAKANRKIEVSSEAKYFNAGVLLLDLDRWRTEGIADDVLAHAKRHRRALRFPDQDALNAVLSTRWLELNPRWNSVLNVVWHSRRRASPRAKKLYDDLLERPAILHFLAGPKPWQPDAFFHRRFLFFHYLDRTEWAGWRPTAVTPRSRPIKASRSR